MQGSKLLFDVLIYLNQRYQKKEHFEFYLKDER